MAVRLTIGLRCQLALFGATKLCFNIYFQVSLDDCVKRYTDAPARFIFKDDLIALYAKDLTAKVALAVDGLARFHLRRMARETLVILPFVEPALQTRRGDFQRIRRMDEVFHIQNGADVQADLRAILVGYAVRLVNKKANDGLAFGACDFGVNQLQPVLRRHTLGNLSDTLSNRTLTHLQTRSFKLVQMALTQKKKWARTHRMKPPRFEQAEDYTESVQENQAGGR